MRLWVSNKDVMDVITRLIMNQLIRWPFCSNECGEGLYLRLEHQKGWNGIIITESTAGEHESTKYCEVAFWITEQREKYAMSLVNGVSNNGRSLNVSPLSERTRGKQ